MAFIKQAKIIFSGSALFRNSAVLFMGVMGASVLNYIFHFAIGRMVSVEDYGKIESLLSLSNIIMIPTLTLSMIVAKVSAGFKANEDKTGSHSLLIFLNKKIILYGVPILVICLLVTPYVNRFLKISEQLPLVLIWVLMFLSFFSATNNGTLSGWQKFKSLSKNGVLSAAVKLVSGIVLVKIGFSLSGAVGSLALGTIAAYIASSISLRFIMKNKKHSWTIDNIPTKSLQSFIIPFFIGNLAINMLGNADMIMAKHILNPLEAGQYGALTIVSKIIFFGTGVIATVLFSMSSESHHKKNDTTEIFRKSSMLMLILAIVGVGMYFLFPKFILWMLFGNKYTDASGYLGWFAVMVALFSYANLLFQYLLSIQKTKMVYGLFLVATISSVTMMFAGKDIYDILKISICSQIAAIVIGLFFLLFSGSGKPKKYLTQWLSFLYPNN